MSGDVGMRLLLSTRVSLGSHSAASGTHPPDPFSSSVWIPNSPAPLLGAEDPQRVQWCAVGHHERAKCDEWSAVSGGALRCTTEETIEDCMAAIVVSRALPPQLGSDTQTHGAFAESSQTPSPQLQG